ncbi:unnamed protein product [Owenia fusiformis]|uniref:MACPF domain-containing protein n=1 Tax=Owenia fusiformis TaxID=6347 RepID=A0A8S4PWJ9_OWEFU|nr:unnamed protein product [Owenia fusiformis]
MEDKLILATLLLGLIVAVISRETLPDLSLTEVCENGDDGHCNGAQSSVSAFKPTPQKRYPLGDYRNCADSEGKLLPRLEALPGGGWDNLRNLDMGIVARRNYSQCLSSEDGMYLIPDGMFVIPQKRTNLETYAEIFEDMTSYSSMTSRSINIEVNVLSRISGSFSYSHQKAKTKQYNDKSMTTRVQVRRHVYTVKLSMDTEIEAALRNRVLDMIGSLQGNNTDEASYLAQLLVRDYGTHIVTSVDVGAILAQEDHVKRSSFLDSKTDSTQFKASASADFFGKVGFKIGVEVGSSDSTTKKYQTSRTHSKVITHGGSSFTPNFTYTNWEKGLVNSLVAIDMSGDPLHYFITPSKFPGIHVSSVRNAARLIERTVNRYYQINTLYGCTKMDSPNFSFESNLDDGSCETAMTNFTFGGVFQKCSLLERSAGNICPELTQKNPLTGDFSCPSMYKAVLLHSGTKRKGDPSNCHEHCYTCWLVLRCCDRICDRSSKAKYDVYWCYAPGHVNTNSGFLFGGIYSAVRQNPLTKSTNCPMHFFALKLGDGVFICVSDDYELGFRFSIPFAGLFSCTAGNPLVLSKDLVNKRSAPRTMMTYLSEAGPASWPHRCPPGYSQHIASIDDGCEIEYCVKVNALSSHGLTPIKRPPFIDIPHINANSTDTMVIMGAAGNAWVKIQDQNWKLVSAADAIDAYKIIDQTKSNARVKPKNTSAIVGIVIGGLAFVVLVAMVVFGIRRKYKNRRAGHSRLVGNNQNSEMGLQDSSQQNQYGTIGSETNMRDENPNV